MIKELKRPLSVFTARANQERLAASSSGSSAEVDSVVKVILANGGEAHADMLQGTDYRATKADFRSKVSPALRKECDIQAESAAMYASRKTGVYVKVKGSGNFVLMKVGQRAT